MYLVCVRDDEHGGNIAGILRAASRTLSIDSCDGGITRRNVARLSPTRPHGQPLQTGSDCIHGLTLPFPVESILKVSVAEGYQKSRDTCVGSWDGAGHTGPFATVREEVELSHTARVDNNALSVDPDKFSHSEYTT